MFDRSKPVLCGNFDQREQVHDLIFVLKRLSEQFETARPGLQFNENQNMQSQKDSFPFLLNRLGFDSKFVCDFLGGKLLTEVQVDKRPVVSVKFAEYPFLKQREELRQFAEHFLFRCQQLAMRTIAREPADVRRIYPLFQRNQSFGLLFDSHCFPGSNRIRVRPRVAHFLRCAGEFVNRATGRFVNRGRPTTENTGSACARRLANLFDC
ncbi:MAG: hypothetical protein AB1813_03945 [Verrucomicrobiota bacterium]